MDEFDGVSQLDQSVAPYVYSQELQQFVNEEETILQLSDKVLGDSLEEGNFSLAFGLLRRFRSLHKASSLGAAKLLHSIKAHWNDIESEQDFLREAVRETGYHQLTIERYVAVWEMLSGDYIPERFLEKIQTQTMRCLVKEASLVIEQGYELEEEEWLAFSEAIDDKTVAELCAKAKGRERSKNHMSLKLDEDGFIHVYRGNEEDVVGQLFYEKDSEVVQKAIKRICDSAGITKSDEY